MGKAGSMVLVAGTGTGGLKLKVKATHLPSSIPSSLREAGSARGGNSSSGTPSCSVFGATSRSRRSAVQPTKWPE